MAASFGAQLYAIDSKLKRITRYSQQQGLAGNLNSLANDNEGNIWVGTRAATSGQRAGITILDPERKEFKILNTNSGLNSDETDAILKDRRGTDVDSNLERFEHVKPQWYCHHTYRE
jgi:hypothetical protein